jgi:TRAP-type C4-dicarboxylate transport system permease large subunit
MAVTMEFWAGVAVGLLAGMVLILVWLFWYANRRQRRRH